MVTWINYSLPLRKDQRHSSVKNHTWQIRVDYDLKKEVVCFSQRVQSYIHYGYVLFVDSLKEGTNIHSKE